MATVVNSCQAGIPSNITRRPFLRFLNLSGDGTTTNSAITGNYSGAITDFYFEAPAGSIYKVGSIIIAISAASKMNQASYGDIAGGLTNGVKLIQRRGGAEVVLIGGSIIKKNYEFLATTASMTLTTFAGTADTLVISFDTYKDLGTYIDLEGDNDDRLIFRVNDNFTTLVDQHVTIRGIIT